MRKVLIIIVCLLVTLGCANEYIGKQLPDLQPGECSDIGMAKGHESLAGLVSLALENNLTIVGTQGSCAILEASIEHKRELGPMLMHDTILDNPGMTCDLLDSSHVNTKNGFPVSFGTMAKIHCSTPVDMEDGSYMVTHIFVQLMIDSNNDAVISFVGGIE